MTTKTVTEPTAAELDAEYKRLAYAVTQGNTVAAVKLSKIEDRIEDAQRRDRRAAAAAAEATRLAATAEREAARAERQAQESAYQSAITCKTAAYAMVEDLTNELVVAIKAALIAGNEAHSSALRLGYSPGVLASSQITTYISWRLGRDGVDTAGLSDMPPTSPAMRVPLVTPPPKES